jgi:hypothetical protein
MLLVLCIIDKKSTATPFCQFLPPERHLGRVAAHESAKTRFFIFVKNHISSTTTNPQNL